MSNFFELKFHKARQKKITHYFNFQAFEAAKSPTQPYTLTLEDIWDCEDLNQMEKQTITNEKTNEQFSVEKVEDDEMARFSTITIKRGMKTKKKT